MESGWDELAARRGAGGPPAAPRFSVYLMRESLERPCGQMDLPAPSCRRERACDVYEASAEAGLETARRGTGAARVETVTRVRVRLSSPAGRFLDLLI